MSTEQQLAELLEFVKTTAEESKGFVVQEAPLLAQEIVAWEFWIGFASIATWVAFSIAISASAFVIHRGFCKTTDPGPPPPLMFSCLTLALILVTGSFALIEGVPRVVKSSVAPRLVIIEYVGRALR